jgi:hypothetical protein
VAAPVTEQHSASDTASKEQSGKEDETNRKHVFTGNVATEPYYRKRRSGKQLADFVLAEHPEDGQTVYRRIRAFDKQAERVRDRVEKGQQVEVTTYSPKQWVDSVKQKDGSWGKQERTDFYAGFLKIPKDAAGKSPTQQ